MTTSPEQPRLLKYYTLFGFFVIGVITVLLGQILPILSTRLNLNDAQAGTLFLAQFSGSMLGTLFATRAAGRVGFVVTVVLGLLLMAVGLPGINAPSFAVCWAAIFVYGAGIGITIPSINLLTIETTPEMMRSSSVNLINFCWGVGAICSQPFVAAVARDNSLTAVTAFLVAAVVVLAICFSTVVRKVPKRSVTETETGSPPEMHIWRRPTSWLFVLFSFFVISIEGGLGGWLTTYSEDLKASGAGTINLTVIYFTFFVLGRGFASIVSRKVSENVLISVCSSLLVVGVLFIVSSETFAVVGAAVAGLGSSAIFPTNMVRFTRVFGAAATRQATPLFISGTLGAASVGSLVGLVSSTFGSLRMGIVAILISAVLVFILQIVIAVVFRYETRPSGAPL